MEKRNNYGKQNSREIGEIELERLPSQIRDLATKVINNPNYDGNSAKLFKNKENLFSGEGPFVEFVGKGNCKRLVLDQNQGVVYVTLNHHNIYFEVI